MARRETEFFLSSSGGAGSGDVSGPATPVTDNAIVRWDGITGEIIQNSTVIVSDDGDITTTGDLSAGAGLFEITAVEDDTKGVIINQDAAGYGDVEALEINYTTGATTLGQDEAAILINIDRSDSTGGDVTALEILATTGGATAIGMFTGIGVAPIEQFVGTFADADTVLANAVDETTDLSQGGAGNVTVFANDNDTITVGSTSKFEEIEFLFDTVSDKDARLTHEFSTGVGTWDTFTPIDGTNGFQQNGEMAWLDADIPTWAVGTGGEYLFRLTRTRNGAMTSPILDIVQISAVTEFKWDENGVVEVAGVTMGGVATNDILTSADGPSSSDEVLVTAGYLDANCCGGGPTDVQTFTSSGTWTKPTVGAGAMIQLEFWRGGQGGGAISAGGVATANGGVGGNYVMFWVRADLFSATETVTVGSGGSGASTTGSSFVAGSMGGHSYFSSTLLGTNNLGGGTSDFMGSPSEASNVSAPFMAGGTGGSADNSPVTIVAPITSTHGGDGGAATQGSGSRTGTAGSILGGGGGAAACDPSGTATGGAGGRGQVIITVWG
jgi:hypothetical protein